MSRFPAEVIFEKQARGKLLKGINIVADAVGSTLGPRGRNVGINQGAGAPRIIHDGVSVARRIDLFDHFEDMGAQLLKEAAIKTNEIAGDGTTTATIIAQAIINKALEDIEAGKNPMGLKEEIEKASEIVLKELKKLSRPIKEDEEIKMVATISSASEKIGKIVAEAITETGSDGLIHIEEGKGYETTVEYKKGLEFNRGYLSPYFVTNDDTVEAVIDDAYILLTDIKINKNIQIVPFLEKLKANDIKNLVIVAGELHDEALATVVVNKLRGAFNVVAVQAPAFGGRRTDELEDLATLTGGSVIMEESGRELASVEIEELGQAKSVIVDRDKTKIIDGKGKKSAVNQRIKDLKNQIKVANTDFDKDIKEERLAKMTGKVAQILVGATTEVELSDKKERINDAVNAAKASIEEGIVAGGQIALLHISEKDIWPETLGAEILREAIKQPFKVLMENTGYDYAEILRKIPLSSYPEGVDVTDGKVKDMIKAGIIDPTKVERSAIENAVSVAGMTMTTACLISEPYERETKE